MIRKNFGKRIEKGDPVHVHWRDAAARNGWHDEDAPRDGAEIHSLGYFLEENRNCIAIAQSVDGSRRYPQVDNVLDIPTPTVIGIEKL